MSLHFAHAVLIHSLCMQDEELALMKLSRMRAHPELYKLPLDPAIARVSPDNSCACQCMLRSRDSMPSNDEHAPTLKLTLSVFRRMQDHEEVELLLERYLYASNSTRKLLAGMATAMRNTDSFMQVSRLLGIITRCLHS